MSAIDHAVNPAAVELPVRPRAEDVQSWSNLQSRASMQKLPAGSNAWVFRTLQNAFEPRPQIKDLVAGILQPKSLNVLYGGPGTLKTMLALDKGLSIASNKSWLPPLPGVDGEAYTVDHSPVMFVDFDSGQLRLDVRIEALARGRGLTPKDRCEVHYISMPTPWLAANERDSVGDLADHIKRRGVRYVLLDNLGTISGGLDENSGQMIQVMSNLRWLAEESGAAVEVIHHERKSTGETRKGGDALRGHSSINASLDLALLVEREENSRFISVRSTKTRDVEVQPFGAEFSFTHRDGTTELKTAQFFGIQSGSDSGDRDIENAILAATLSPKNQIALISEVQKSIPTAGKHRIRSLADSLVARNKLDRTTGSHGAKVYKPC